MNVAMDVLLLSLLLLVATWTLLFGSAGAFAARRAGQPAFLGFTVGSLLGPFGVAWFMWKGRAKGRAPRAVWELSSDEQLE